MRRWCLNTKNETYHEMNGASRERDCQIGKLVDREVQFMRSGGLA